ncbi:hypothetical protein [Cesiribacter sp. SM1]|uniref:hypothetical protein n=1 Tax=Cesiribacter sp. SM1 TaxID=2861196 RepID=UPI001CD500A1|nr:hypothetical protein [Cesiribacter sp. SM1]
MQFNATVKAFLLTVVLSVSGVAAAAQHYQLTVSAITNCSTLACITEIQQKNKDLKTLSPYKREIGAGIDRLLLDFSLPHGGKQEEGDKALNSPKHFRLSLLVEKDSILYGQLEQLSDDQQLETTYLFRNQADKIEHFVDRFNRQHKTLYTYQDLVKTVTSRTPFLWMWLK